MRSLSLAFGGAEWHGVWESSGSVWKWCFEPMSLAEMSKGVSADGEGERAKDRASAGGRDREGDRECPRRASRPVPSRPL